MDDSNLNLDELERKIQNWPDEVSDDELYKLIALARKGLRIDGLFNFIAHGDDQHRAWLNKAIEAYFNGEEVPPPSGKSKHEERAEIYGKALREIDEMPPEPAHSSKSAEMRMRRIAREALEETSIQSGSVDLKEKDNERRS